MKLHYHPVSTTSRMIMLFAADHGIDLDYEVVDLFTGAHFQPAYSAINPSRQVPVLEDGDFRLTESAAILRYLAEKVGSPAYPAEPRKRATVNERMDWLNSGFYRDFGYGLVYPQIFPHLKRPDPTQQAGTLAWGRDRARDWLKVLDQHFIGPRNAYLCGNEITLADYFGAPMLVLGDVINCDYADFPNLRRWLDTMRSRPNWPKVHEAFQQYVVAPTRGTAFETI
jgi:glutathione S-transferase